MFLSENLSALLSHQAYTSLESFQKQREALKPLLGNQAGCKLAPEWDAYMTTTGELIIEPPSGPLNDPERVIVEARNAVHTLSQSGKNRIHVLVGLGAGYLLQALFEASPGSVWILETDTQLLEFVLENVNLSRFFQSERVRVYRDIDTLKTDLTPVMAGRELDILTLPGTLKHFEACHGPNSFSTLAAGLYEIESLAKLDWNTFTSFKPMWTERFFANLPYTPDALLFDALQSVLAQRLTGQPALIISRGPSLEAALPALKTCIDGQVLTIAVGGALRPMMEAGLTPDIALFCDARHMAEQLYDLPLPTDNILFLLNPITETCCFETPSLGKALLLNSGIAPFCTWLKQALDVVPQHGSGFLEGASSVSMFGFQVAQALGCQTIVLIGQDLALKGDQIYAGGVNALPEGEKYVLIYPPEEERCKTPVCGYEWTTIAGQKGETLKTTVPYAFFAKQLEQLAIENRKRTQPLRLVNASVGGALLQGFEHQSLQDLLPELVPVPDQKQFLSLLTGWKTSLNQAILRQQKDAPRRLKALITELRAWHQVVEMAIAACKDIVETCTGALGGTVLTRSHWRDCYRSATERLETIHQACPFLEYLTTDLRWNLDKSADGLMLISEGQQGALQATLEAYEQCGVFLESQLLPWTEHALEICLKRPFTEPG